MSNQIETDQPIRRVLVTYDGSPASRSAFGHATNLARLMDAEVLLARVFFVPPHIWVHPEAAVRDAELAKLQAAWESELAALAAELQQSSGVAVRPLVRTLGQRFTVADEVLAAADEFDVVLLCVATQGESALRHLIVGSVAMSIVSRSDRPVVLARVQPAT